MVDEQLEETTTNSGHDKDSEEVSLVKKAKVTQENYLETLNNYMTHIKEGQNDTWNVKHEEWNMNRSYFGLVFRDREKVHDWTYPNHWDDQLDFCRGHTMALKTRDNKITESSMSATRLECINHALNYIGHKDSMLYGIVLVQRGNLLASIAGSLFNQYHFYLFLPNELMPEFQYFKDAYPRDIIKIPWEYYPMFKERITL